MSYTEKSGLIRGLIIQKGLIGFDGDLFVAGKRAENAGVHWLMYSRKQQVLNLTALSSLSLPELRARINQ